jgi:hypothetical protein
VRLCVPMAKNGRIVDSGGAKENHSGYLDGSVARPDAV